MRHLLFLILCLPVAAQVKDYGSIASAGAVYDHTLAARTAPNKTGTTANIPSPCQAGDTYLATDAPKGRQHYRCIGGTWHMEAYEAASSDPPTCVESQMYWNNVSHKPRWCITDNTWGDTPGATSGEGAAPNYRAAPLWIDDFAKGTFSSNNIGDMRWTLTNGTGASGAMIASTAGRPGLFQFGSGTTTTTINAPGLASSFFHSSDNFDVTLIYKLDHNDANTTVRTGVNCTGTYNNSNPNVGVYIEKEDADTSFFGVTYNGAGNENRISLGSTNTSYHSFRLRRIDATTVGFTMDANAELTTTAHVPSAACNLIMAISNSSGSGNKQFTVDYVSVAITGLTR